MRASQRRPDIETVIDLLNSKADWKPLMAEIDLKPFGPLTWMDGTGDVFRLRERELIMDDPRNAADAALSWSWCDAFAKGVFDEDVATAVRKLQDQCIRTDGKGHHLATVLLDAELCDALRGGDINAPLSGRAKPDESVCKTGERSSEPDPGQEGYSGTDPLTSSIKRKKGAGKKKRKAESTNKAGRKQSAEPKKMAPPKTDAGPNQTARLKVSGPQQKRHELLERVRDFLSDFISLPNQDDLDVLTVWIAHTYFIELLEVSPRLAFMSPQPGCGKTRALDLLDMLAYKPIMTGNTSTSALYRTINAKKGKLTLLVDEVDTILQPNNTNAEAIRGIMNSGYKRGASVIRSGAASKDFETEKFTVFAPLALAGIGTLPDSLLTRSVVIAMQKKKSEDRLLRFRRRTVEPEARSLVAALTEWANFGPDRLEPPQMPDELEDRAAEIWEPLLAVAELAGPLWSETLRRAAVTAVTAVTGSATGELLDNRLLRTLQSQFEQADSLNLSTSAILSHLTSLEDPDLSDLTAARLSKLLRPYGIQPHVFRDGDTTVRGYSKDSFGEAWSRYL